MRQLARQLYIYIINKDDEKLDGLRAQPIVRWLGRFGWPNHPQERR